jgi:hypothetical protein
MTRTALVLLLGLWGVVPASGQTGYLGTSGTPPSDTVSSPSAPGFMVAAPGTCGTCNTGCASCGPRSCRTCGQALRDWLSYCPGPYRGNCGGCGSCGSCCKQGYPCCFPQLYTFFLHRCGPRWQPPKVYKYWEGKFPPAFVGNQDYSVLYDLRSSNLNITP